MYTPGGPVARKSLYNDHLTVNPAELIPERLQFLTDLLDTAVEHAGYGFFYVHEDNRTDEPTADAYVLAIDKEDEGEDKPKVIRIDLGIIRKGLEVINRSVMRVDDEHPDDGEVLHNIDTGERLYLSPQIRDQLMLANISNGDSGNYDVIGALAVVECGLYGTVIYA